VKKDESMRKVWSQRVVKGFLALLVASIFPLFIAVSSASAGTTPPTTTPAATTGATTLCPTSTASSVAASTTASNYLPANRWLGSLGTTHTDLSLGFNIGNDIAYAQRSGLISPLMSAGDTEWGLGVSSTEFANNFCISSSVGTAVDSASAAFDNALVRGNIIVIVVIVALVALLISRIRGSGKGLLSSLFRIVVVVAIFTLMINASSATTATNPDPTFSPAWILNTVYGTVSAITSKPTELMAAAVSGIGANGGGQALGDPLNCYYYNEALVDTYSGAAGGVSAADGGSAGVGSNYAAVPIALNTLWEGLAVPTYVEEQFGSSNNFGLLSYCHLLEQNAGIRPRYQAQMESAAIALSESPSLAGTYDQSSGAVSGGILGSTGSSSSSSLAWNGAISPQTQDESMVGWAACQTNASTDMPMEWDVQSGGLISPSEWTQVDNSVTPSGSAAVAADDCQAFFETPVHDNGGTTYGTPTVMAGGIANSDYSVFNWWAATPANIESDTSGTVPSGLTVDGAPASTINGEQYGAGIADYLNNLHGTSNVSAETAALLFLFSSTIIMLVFFGLSIALLISKIALLLLLLMLPIMLIFMLLPFANSEGKFLMMAKKTLSLVIFSTCVGLVLSVIAGISSMLATVGSALTGPGSIFALLWIGLCPLVSIYIIHMFFKKVLKAPSPFKPSSVMGYAASAGTLGAIGGAELESHWAKARRMAGNYASNNGVPGAGAIAGRRGGGRHRRGGMSGGGRGGSGSGAGKAGEHDAGSGAPSGDSDTGGTPTGGDTTTEGLAATQAAAGVEGATAGGRGTTKVSAAARAKNFSAAARAKMSKRDAEGATHRVAGAKDTAKAVGSRLVNGAKYVGPHPLEAMRGKSVMGKVAVAGRKSAKYAAIGTVGLAMAPVGAGVLGLGAIAAGAVGAAAVGRKLHTRRHGITKPDRSVRQPSVLTPDDQGPTTSPDGRYTTADDAHVLSPDEVDATNRRLNEWQTPTSRTVHVETGGETPTREPVDPRERSSGNPLDPDVAPARQDDDARREADNEEFNRRADHFFDEMNES
jgi:hypothetical protein